MDAKILRIQIKDKNSAIVILEILSADKKQKYTISEGTYREIGCPLSNQNIDENVIAVIAEEDEQRRALQKSLSILTYADNCEKSLYLKLIRSGFSKSSAKNAVEECLRLGYIDEKRQIEHYAESANRELIGPYKIATKLISRGYAPGKVFSTLSELEASGIINFKESKQKLLEEKCTEQTSADERKKLLHRYGYIK